jgi:hypothetical protein
MHGSAFFDLIAGISGDREHQKHQKEYSERRTPGKSF